MTADYADRYYRSGNYHTDRRLTRNGRIYRGQNGHYYCRRGEVTTGLIVGGAVGALIGRAQSRRVTRGWHDHRRQRRRAARPRDRAWQSALQLGLL